MHKNPAIISNTDHNQTEKTTNFPTSSEKVKIGKTIYEIQRHFSGERDIREAIFAAVENEAFRKVS